MGDPLSVAAGITGLISFASELAGICFSIYKYGVSVKKAPEAARKVRGVLGGLRRVLLDLEELYCGTLIEDFKISLDPKTKGWRHALDRLLWPTKKDDVNEFITQIESHQRRFEAAKANDGILLLEKTLGITREVRSQLHGQEHDRILKWLSPLDFGRLQTDLYHHRRRKLTSTWILEDLRYLRWRDNSSSAASGLWCTGDPGAGKSITSSVVVKDLSSLKAVGFAYVYCLYQDTGLQSAEALLGSLARQLMLTNPSLLGMAKECYTRWKHETIPRIKPLIQLIYNMCSAFKRSYLVFDGLDELRPSTLKSVLPLFEKLQKSTIHFLVFSRSHDVTINEAFRSAEHMLIRAQVEDIKAAVEGWIKEDQHIQSISSGDKGFESQIATGIIRKSAGLFGLAQRHLMRLSQETCQQDILDRIEELEESLEGEYARSIERILAQAEPRRRLALRVLHWMCHTLRSLTCDELLEALAIHKTDNRVRASRKPILSDVLSVCVGLVTGNEISATLDLFHFTLKEYLLSRPELFDGVADLGESCLVYLGYEDFGNVATDYQLPSSYTILGRTSATEIVSIEFWAKYPFSAYAANFWADHVRAVGEDAVYDRLLRFLATKNTLSAIQLQSALPGNDNMKSAMILGNAFEYSYDIELDTAFAVFVCTCFQLQGALRRLFQDGAYPNFRAPWGGEYSSLHIAVLQHDEETIGTFVDAKADINIRDRWGLTPLHLEVKYNAIDDSSSARNLLKAGANPDIQDQDGHTVLHLAVRHADIETVRTVLQKCKVNIQDKNGDTAFHHAVRLAYVSAIEVLLSRQADPTLRNRQGKSCLALAVDSKSYLLTKLLLESPRTVLEYEYSPEDLHAAESFTKPIDSQPPDAIQAQIDLERREAESRYPLVQRSSFSTLEDLAFADAVAYAAENGEFATLKRLLSQGADVNRQDQHTGRTALHHAAVGGRAKAIRYLLGAGADASIQDREGRTARELAVRYSPGVAEVFDLPVLHSRLTRPLLDVE